MTIFDIAIIFFLVLETTNVVLLWFAPASKWGNAMGAFDAYARLEGGEIGDPVVRDLVRYLVNWVAGTKLVFIMLLVVIVITGTLATKVGAALALVLSILTYFWRLHPLMVRLDREGQISPRGYSRTLGLMIGGFILVFAGALG